MYEVYLERSAERDLRRLSAKVFSRIIPEIRADWRIRIGDYRVIYEIDEKTSIVRVMRVRHRRQVYR
jgi:mRNA interferase RelE/StbE